MKDTNQTYDQILNDLRKVQPIPSHPAELTRQIMGKINVLPQRKKAKNSKLKLLRTWAQIAAILVVGILVYEMIKPHKKLNFSSIPFPEAESTQYTEAHSFPVKEKIKQYIIWQEIQTEKKKYRKELISVFQTSNPKSLMP